MKETEPVIYPPKQRKNSFDYVSIKKSLKGVLIAGFGVAVMYTLEALPGVDFGKYSPVVAAGCSIILNTIREYLKGEEKCHD